MKSRPLQRTVDAFFYGLFMEEALLRKRGLHPSAVRQGHVRGYGLRIGNRATLVPSVGEQVYGIVMSLPMDDLSTLYAEPSVAAYRPEAVLVHLDDGPAVPALCYNLPTPPEPDERNPDYAANLRALATRLALPASYIESIR